MSASSEKIVYRFFSSLGLLVALNVVIKPVWIFGIDREVQLQAGSSSYGHYFALFNLTVVLGFLLDWGLTSYVQRQLSAGQGELLKYAGNLLGAKTLMIFAYVIAVSVTAAAAGIRDWRLLATLVLMQVMTSLFLFFRSVITAHQWFRTDAWFSVLDKALLILLCGSVLYFPLVFETLTVERFAFFQLACISLATLSALSVLFCRGVRFELRMKNNMARRLLRDIWPFAAILFVMAAHYRLDGFLIERLSDASEAGLYAAGFRLLDATNMVGYLFASFLLPFAARHAGTDRETVNSVVLGSRDLLLLGSILIATCSFFLSDWLAILLYGGRIDGAATILSSLMPALIGLSLVQIYGTVLTATGHLHAFCLIILAALFLSVGTNLLLIPHYGARAAAWTAVFSQAAAGAGCMLYCTLRLKMPAGFRNLCLHVLAAIILSMFLFAGTRWGINEWLLVGVSAVIAGVFVLLMRPELRSYWSRLKTSVI